MVLLIEDILEEHKDNIELKDFIDISEQRFLLYFKNRYNENPIIERVNDWKSLIGLIKLALIKEIDFNWHENYEFPSGNIGSLASLVIEYDGWILLNDSGLVDPITKDKF
jgi:hypothetical protein